MWGRRCRVSLFFCMHRLKSTRSGKATALCSGHSNFLYPPPPFFLSDLTCLLICFDQFLVMANNYSQDDVASYDSGSVNATVSHNHAYSMTRTPSNPSRLSMSYQLPASPPAIHTNIQTVASPTEAFASFASPTSAFPTQTVSSPTQAFMPMQSLASFSSPDDMLKAYAERRTGSPALGASSGLASPPAAYNGLRND